ncbi:bifunctional acetaldehyde-CoA/alcohol dehydrogenase [Dehalobacter sp. DCM]|uniref:bifunctional acetaldehyde-CoA/alcohol dehydrogenase n=1 Tax=Dehalobacter sp. DCM TaxID=2907827 RepID=UPI003081CB33|nr:bifunctional acetaldehyde-CoA/alcohol dehydrogenase [Dehalobacter sp. DCM]
MSNSNKVPAVKNNNCTIHDNITIGTNGSIDKLIDNAQNALLTYMEMSQEHVDSIVKEMALAGLKNQLVLAKLAVEETGRGVVEDKVIKNIFATEYIYHSIKYEKTVGIVEDNENEGYVEIAEPVGVIAGVTPVTNPTSTTLFKAIIAVKTRNPIIFAFHPSSQKCSVEAAKIVRDAAVKAGAPAGCIQWITEPSLEATRELMNHRGIALILATGGSGLVRAAYSAGKPALGVGPGNVPCYIEKSANIYRAVTDIIISKTFDNGMICASEQAVIVDNVICPEFIGYMKKLKCYFLSPEEIAQLEKVAVNADKGGINAEIVGKSAYAIAKMAGLNVPDDTKILIAELHGVGDSYPLSREKLSPVLAFYRVNDYKQGIAMADQMVRYGGLGHSAVIHSDDSKIIEEFAKAIKTGRLIVNAPSTHGAIGDLYNTNIPSLTLGCGSFGKNSTTANVTAVNLLNKKRLAKRKVNMQWFKIPDRIYFEYGSVQYLAKMPDISRAVIVTDKVMQQAGYVDTVLFYLRKREKYVHSEVFLDVEPDPSIDTVKRGVALIEAFQPDVIIALGGGSPIDAAKAMWMFYEFPEVDFEALTFKFMDIRKRIYKIPRIGAKARFVAIPTTSGTGSEVTSFTVITDKKTGIKYPIADYELTPDVAIVDPQFTLSIPASVTADTGIDVLTHALEAYVSVLASDYTDALAIKAIQLVFKYLPRAYRNGNDREAREKMHNASCIAGMAFTNAFLGINHSLAHKLGGEFHIPHGRANGIMLPHVIQYNSEIPNKITTFPKYDHYVATEKYADIATYLGMKHTSAEQGVKLLIDAVRTLIKEVGLPQSISQTGVSKDVFESKVSQLAEEAFQDQTTTANPRMPLIHELEELYRNAY